MLIWKAGCAIRRRRASDYGPFRTRSIAHRRSRASGIVRRPPFPEGADPTTARSPECEIFSRWRIASQIGGIIPELWV